MKHLKKLYLETKQKHVYPHTRLELPGPALLSAHARALLQKAALFLGQVLDLLLAQLLFGRQAPAGFLLNSEISMLEISLLNEQLLVLHVFIYSLLMLFIKNGRVSDPYP